MNVAFSSQLPPKHMRLSRNASRSMGVFPGGSVRVNLTVEDELCVHLICFPSSDIDENIIILPDWIDKNFHVKGDQITMKVVDNSKARVCHTLQIRKVFGNVWLPPTRVLLDVRKRAMPRSKVINDWENVVTRNLGKYFLSLNAVFAVHICGELCIFKVERIEIDGLPMTKEDTVRNNAQNTQIEILPELSFIKNVPMIGGLGKEIEELRRLIDESFSNFDIHNKLNIPITRAVMISGPRGAGKSLLIHRNVCQKIQAQLFEISLASVVSVVSQIRDQAEFLENNLIRWTFTKAILSAPSVIVIEGFDLLDN
ncbi:626_t:CDS:2, partial [Paraglomus occultum]